MEIRLPFIMIMAGLQVNAHQLEFSFMPNPKIKSKRTTTKKRWSYWKKSQVIIEQQAIGSSYIPSHKFKENFIDYFGEYNKLNKGDGNRHLICCFSKFKEFIDHKSFIAPLEISENFCKRFRRYLLDKLTGETPANYFARFKWVIDAATSDGYFVKNPTANISAVSNPSVALKEHLDSATVAYLLGHTTTKQVERTYKRHRPKDQSEAINKLPTPKELPFFLKSSFTESGK